MLVAVVASVGYFQTRKALEGEAQQRKRAEETSDLALEALENIFQQLAPERVVAASEYTVYSDGQQVDVPIYPVQSEETAELLKNLLVFFDRLAEQESTDSQLQHRAALANRRVGDIYQRLGQFEEAEQAYLNAIEKYQSLTRDTDQADLIAELASVFNALGNVYGKTHDREKAQQSHLKAVEILQDFAPQELAPHRLNYELARSYYYLGRKNLRSPVAKKTPRKPKGFPKSPLKKPRSFFKGDKMPLLQEFLQHRIEEKYLQKSISMLEDLTRDYPDIPVYRHLLALCYRELASGLWLQHSQTSIESAQKAIDLLQDLVAEYPQVPDYRYELSETYAIWDVRGPVFPEDKAPLLEQHLTEARKLSDELAGEFPNVPDYLVSQAHIYHKLAFVYQRTGRPKETDEHFQKALDIQNSLVQRYSDVSFHRVWQIKFQVSYADFLYKRGDKDRARELLEESVQDHKALIQEDPQYRFLHFELRMSYGLLSKIYRDLGEPELAAEAKRQFEHYRSIRPPRIWGFLKKKLGEKRP